MNQPNNSEWRKVAGISVIAGGVLCYGMGLAGYMAFRDATEGDILDNFVGPPAGLFKALVIVHLVLYIPSEVCLSLPSISLLHMNVFLCTLSCRLCEFNTNHAERNIVGCIYLSAIVGRQTIWVIR